MMQKISAECCVHILKFWSICFNMSSVVQRIWCECALQDVLLMTLRPFLMRQLLSSQYCNWKEYSPLHVNQYALQILKPPLCCQVICNWKTIFIESCCFIPFCKQAHLMWILELQIQYLVSRWRTDPDAQGCYSYDVVGKPHNLYAQLRMPVDNIFFAGEATSERFPGTVHGAFATGVMAGVECRERFTEWYQDLEIFHPVRAEESELVTPLQISRLWWPRSLTNHYWQKVSWIKEVGPTVCCSYKLTR